MFGGAQTAYCLGQLIFSVCLCELFFTFSFHLSFSVNIVIFSYSWIVVVEWKVGSPGRVRASRDFWRISASNTFRPENSIDIAFWERRNKLVPTYFATQLFCPSKVRLCHNGHTFKPSTTKYVHIIYFRCGSLIRMLSFMCIPSDI